MPQSARPAPAILLGALLLASAAHAAPPHLSAAPDTLEQRLVACAACHARKDAQGVPGNDRYFPRIAGKPAGYLYNQLVNFRDGRRQYPLMTWMVDHLPDAYLHEIADYFAAQHLPAPAPARAEAPQVVLDRGRQLVTHGDPAIKVPACIACHGEKLTGVLPSIPGLVGLPRDYVNAQFGAWRNKVRQAHAPDCMGGIASRLSLADVSAISGWLATQPVPADARPAAAISRPLPLACGSAPEQP
ncbi:MAG: c-type cytochrome [Massilia sp.]